MCCLRSVSATWALGFFEPNESDVMTIAFTEYVARRAKEDVSGSRPQNGSPAGLGAGASLDRAAQAPLVTFSMTVNELELHRVVQLLQRGGVDLSRARVDQPTPDGSAAPAEHDEAGVLRFGDIEVNQAARSIHRNGAEVHLAPKEFDLLIALLRRSGAAASRGDLAREVWGSESAASGRTIDTHVCALRRKLEADQRRPRHIRVVSKVGYRLER